MERTAFTVLVILLLAVALISCGRGIGGDGSTADSQPSQPSQPPDPPPYAGVQVLTRHGNNARTGLNAEETVLQPSNVNVSTFGKLFSYQVDGYIYAQPLYVSNVRISGGTHNIVYVATEYDSVYAFDADSPSNSSPLWKTSLLKAGETPLAGGAIKPWIGVTSTPVIDVTGKTMYVVSRHAGGAIRLNALNIETGSIIKSLDVGASVASTLLRFLPWSQR